MRLFTKPFAFFVGSDFLPFPTFGSFALSFPTFPPFANGHFDASGQFPTAGHPSDFGHAFWADEPSAPEPCAHNEIADIKNTANIPANFISFSLSVCVFYISELFSISTPKKTFVQKNFRIKNNSLQRIPLCENPNHDSPRIQIIFRRKKAGCRSRNQKIPSAGRYASGNSA